MNNNKDTFPTAAFVWGFFGVFVLPAWLIFLWHVAVYIATYLETLT